LDERAALNDYENTDENTALDEHEKSTVPVFKKGLQDG